MTDSMTAQANGRGVVDTSDADANNILNAIFSTGAAVALIATLFLDNTVPGTDRERGLHVWCVGLCRTVPWLPYAVHVVCCSRVLPLFMHGSFEDASVTAVLQISSSPSHLLQGQCGTARRVAAEAWWDQKGEICTDHVISAISGQSGWKAMPSGGTTQRCWR